MAKKFYDLLEESHKLKEAENTDTEDEMDKDLEIKDDDAEEEPKEETLDDVAPDGKGEYDAEDLREVIDYVYDILDKEDDDEDNDSVEEIGLDLIREYADSLPDTVINQIINDLKDMFEIEDTLLESIINESSLFMRSKKGKAAQMAKKISTKVYQKNKKAIKAEAKAWRTSKLGKKISSLHQKHYKGLCKHTKTLRTPLGMPERDY